MRSIVPVLAVLAVLAIALVPAASALEVTARVLESHGGCEEASDLDVVIWNNGTHRGYGETWSSSSTCDARTSHAGADASHDGETVASADTGSRSHDERDTMFYYQESGPATMCTNPYTGGVDHCRGEYAYGEHEERSSEHATGAWASAGGEHAFAGRECRSTSGWHYDDAGTWDWESDEADWLLTFDRTERTTCEDVVVAGGERIVLRRCESEDGMHERQTPDEWTFETSSRDDCTYGPVFDADVSGTGTAADGTGVASGSRVEDRRSQHCAEFFSQCTTQASRSAVVDLQATTPRGGLGTHGAFGLP